ncbi:hypothetical protein O181_029345 [Austropuccinia psidii MF-1]|uniref:Uncharacterized protein n=1 Tax=Austropuccinia psidii MF-1 TaxID=1389203 RepID=A0A9Q3CUA6_9BASI|nr:hypothetical protein [Austropuccinia psidii MF-1]
MEHLRASLAPLQASQPVSSLDSRVVMSAYDKFLQAPFKALPQVPTLHATRSNYAEWLIHVNKVLSYTFSSAVPVEGEPSLLSALSPVQSRVVFHCLDSTVATKFSLTLGPHPATVLALAFFNTINSPFSPGNRFEKMETIKEWMDVIFSSMNDAPMPMSELISWWQWIFASVQCLKISPDEPKGIFLQATASQPPQLN